MACLGAGELTPDHVATKAGGHNHHKGDGDKGGKGNRELFLALALTSVRLPGGAGPLAGRAGRREVRGLTRRRGNMAGDRRIRTLRAGILRMGYRCGVPRDMARRLRRPSLHHARHKSPNHPMDAGDVEPPASKTNTIR